MINYPLLISVNPLNVHAAKAKLTWQCVCSKQSQSDLLTITGYKVLYKNKKVGSTTFENKEDIMSDTKLNWTTVVRPSMFILIIVKF